MTAWVDTVLEADQRGLQLDRKMDNLIRAARFEIDAVETGVKSNHCGHITILNTARPGLQQSVRFGIGVLNWNVSCACCLSRKVCPFFSRLERA